MMTSFLTSHLRPRNFAMGNKASQTTNHVGFGYQQQLVPGMRPGGGPMPNFFVPVVQQGQQEQRLGGRRGTGSVQQNQQHVPMMQHQVLDYIEDTGLNALSLSCKELRELRAFPSDPFAADANVSLAEQDLVSVSEGCSKLQSVLYFCRQMSNSALTTIAKNRPNLTCFRLCILEPRAPDYETLEPLDHEFGAIVDHCKQLQRLSLSGLIVCFSTSGNVLRS